MFLSSNDDTPADTPTPQRPFSQLALFDKQMHTSRPPLGQAVQAASFRMSSSLSRSGSVVKPKPGKLNFGVVMGGGGDESSRDVGLEVDR